MIIRAAHEADAPAMGRVMVETYMAAHRDQMPAEAWAKRAEEWTPEESAQGWARTLREIAAGQRLHECIYVAEDEGEIIGLSMGGPAETDSGPPTGAVYALYVATSHHGRGIGRRLVAAVAAELAQHGMLALQIGCLAANTPARRFYEKIGGRLVAERLFDEDGIMLPEVVYEWSDIKTLVPDGNS